jgi:hypothetical protein
MELTWLAVAASLMMALGAACVFIYAVRKNWMHNLEDTKYQVFWSDPDQPVNSSKERARDGNGDQDERKP